MPAAIPFPDAGRRRPTRGQAGQKRQSKKTAPTVLDPASRWSRAALAFRDQRCIPKNAGGRWQAAFPIQVTPPDLSTLPEGGLGIFMIHALVDEVVYNSGTRNVLSLTKRT